MNDRKTFYFSSFSRSWIPELTISPRVGSNAQRHQPSQSTYQRFVTLANSGQYSVEIQPFDCGVAWELRRKAAKPARLCTWAPSCTRPALKGDIFCAQCRANEDARLAIDYVAIAQAYYDQVAQE